MLQGKLNHSFIFNALIKLSDRNNLQTGFTKRFDNKAIS